MIFFKRACLQSIFSKRSELNLESLNFKKNPKNYLRVNLSVWVLSFYLYYYKHCYQIVNKTFLQSLLMINELLMYLLYLSLFKTHVYTSRLSRDSYLFKKTVLKVYIINHVEAYWVRVTWIVEFKVGDQLRSCRQRIQ